MKTAIIAALIALFPLAAVADTTSDILAGIIAGDSRDRANVGAYQVETTHRDGDSTANFQQYQIERAERDPAYGNSLNRQIDQNLHGLSQFQDTLRQRQPYGAYGNR